jgi:hypothetical protein
MCMQENGVRQEGRINSARMGKTNQSGCGPWKTETLSPDTEGRYNVMFSYLRPTFSPSSSKQPEALQS